MISRHLAQNSAIWLAAEELDKSCLRLTLVFDSCKTKQIYLIRDHRIMTLDEDQNLIILYFNYFIYSKL